MIGQTNRTDKKQGNKETDKFLYLMDNIFTLYRWSGNWFPYAVSKSKVCVMQETCRLCILIPILFAQLIFCLVDFILRIPDTSKMMMNAVSTVYIIQSVLRICNSVIQGPKIWQIFENFQKCQVPQIFRLVDPQIGRDAPIKTAIQIKRIFFAYACTMGFCVLLTNVSPYLMSYEAIIKKLYKSSNNRTGLFIMVYESWYPFDFSTSPAYELVLFCQSMIILTLGFATTTSDIIYLACVIRTIEEINVLQEMLKVMVVTDAVDNSKNEKLDANVSNAGINWPKNDKLLLHAWISHHQFVLEIIRELQNAFSYLLLIAYTGYFVSFIIIAYCGVRINDHIAIASLATLFILIIVQALAYAYYTDTLNCKSKQLFNSLFWAEWWEASAKVQNTYRIACLMASREIKLSGSGFVIMNIPLFLTALKAAVSYIMVLIQLTNVPQTDK